MKHSKYIKPQSVIITLQAESPILAMSGLGDGEQTNPGINSGLSDGQQENPGFGGNAPWQEED